MYQKVITSYYKSGAEPTDILIHIYSTEDEDLHTVSIQCWINELFYGEKFCFQTLAQARNFVRDYSTVSAADFLDRACAHLGESPDPEPQEQAATVAKGK
jgi:hypothetical protein